MLPWHLRYLPASGPDEGFAALVDGVADHGYAVVKEVHTYLAVEQWARRCDGVVIVERDPLAVAASWHELGYEVRFRIDLMLGQPRLLDEHLDPYVDHLRRSPSWFGDVGRYWGASYHVLRRVAAEHPTWHWVTHEALCARPGPEFSGLLAGRAIDDGALAAFLRDHDRAPTTESSPYETVRDTAAEPVKWRGALSPEQARDVLAGAEPFGLLDPAR
jgi:hypothetical protein